MQEGARQSRRRAQASGKPGRRAGKTKGVSHLKSQVESLFGPFGKRTGNISKNIAFALDQMTLDRAKRLSILESSQRQSNRKGFPMCFRPAAVELNKKCPQCGKSCEPTDTVCPDCGAELPSGPAMPGMPGAPGTPGAPGAPKAPGAPAAPGAPKAPGAK